MSRRLDGSVPKHRSIFFNRLRDYIAYFAVGLLAVIVLSLFAITYSLKRDCTNTDQRNFEIAGYWFHSEMGKLDEGCPAPYHE